MKGPAMTQANQNSPHVSRPGGVTLLVVLGVIQGIGSALTGLFVLLDQNDATLQSDTRLSDNQLTATGAVLILIGALYILLSIMLSRGSSLVRWIYGILAMFNVSAAVWGLLALRGEQQLGAAVSLVFGVIVLWILFGTERSDQFFGSD
jgi:hypothetical protein